MTLQAITTKTPAGEFHLVMEAGSKVVRASGFGPLEDLLMRLPKNLQHMSVKTLPHHPYQQKITAYFNGDAAALATIPTKQEGSDFHQSVWQAMSTIAHGKTASYKELAAKAGNQAAVRAAGTACGRNRLILLVPCHRVLKSDGTLGNYLYGHDIKRRLLATEGIVLQ